MPVDRLLASQKATDLVALSLPQPEEWGGDGQMIASDAAMFEGTNQIQRLAIARGLTT